MAEKKYYWLKLKEDFFSDLPVKKLRKIAGGDTYTIIYLKLLLYSLKDGGVIYYNGLEESFHEELALVLDEEPDNVNVTVNFLLKVGLMEKRSESDYFLTQMNEYLGSETRQAASMRRRRVAEQLEAPKKPEPKTNAQRQKAFRAKAYVEKQGHVPLCENDKNLRRYGGNYYICFRRDGCRCAICGSNDTLCMHHIDGYDENKPENNAENKMITLCRSCHIRVHRSGLEIPQDVLERIGYYDSNESNENALPDVTEQLPSSYTDIDIEKDKEIEKDKRYKEVIAYLNEKAGTAYKDSSKANQRHINARLAEGFTVEDFKTVIDKKCAEWLGTDMEKYLRPETLFGSKFESYLNAPTNRKPEKNSHGFKERDYDFDELARRLSEL